MKFNELTKEHMIELAKVWYPFDNGKIYFEDSKFNYQSHDEFGREEEQITFTFRCNTFADTIDDIHMLIGPTLDMYIGYTRANGSNSIPIHNMYNVVSKLMEFGLKPKKEED